MDVVFAWAWRNDRADDMDYRLTKPGPTVIRAWVLA